MPLALHVDYWDYLGWKDTMGSPAFTARQKNYAHVAGHGTIYTPQMIIGGNSNVIGHKPMAVAKAISDAQAQAIDVGLQVERTGELVTISADAVPGLPRNMVVELVRFIPVYEVAIKRGENAGRTIRYVNAVTDLNEVGRWNGRAQLSMRVRAAGDRGLAVILQEPGPGRVIAVARLN